MNRFNNKLRENAKSTENMYYLSKNKKICYKYIKINLQFSFSMSLHIPF